MKLQAHLPTFGIGPRDWHAAMNALASLFGAAVLLLALQSGVLPNSPLLEGLQTSAVPLAFRSIFTYRSLRSGSGNGFQLHTRCRETSLHRNDSQLAWTRGPYSRPPATRRFATCWPKREQYPGSNRVVIV